MLNIKRIKTLAKQSSWDNFALGVMSVSGANVALARMPHVETRASVKNSWLKVGNCLRAAGKWQSR